MITVDTSALIAILRREPEADRFIRAISTASGCVLSAVSDMEASIVLAGRHGSSTAWFSLDELVAAAAMAIVPHDAELALAAREAFLRFGKGRHPAALNLGDCAAYAVAKNRSLPLLFKGNDFPATDIAAMI